MYKVLVADDEPFILEGIKHIINWEEYGIEFTGTASNGVEALEMLKKEGADLLITDIKMPKMSGLELIKKVRELQISTRFIILSGFDDFEYLKESIKLGIENYLLKPIDAQELEATVVNALNKLEDCAWQKIYLNKDINIIRNNILYRWVSGSINQNELVERASLLDISLEASPYLICILRVIRNAENSTDYIGILQKTEEICTNIIKYNNMGHVFSTAEGYVVFMLHGLEGSVGYKDYVEATNECLNDLKKNLDINYFFTIGSVENTYNLVQRSYHRALELQQYAITLPRDSILNYNNFEQVLLKEQIHEVVSYDEILKFVWTKDSDSLLLYIDKSFKDLLQIKGLTPSLVKNTATELLFCIINSAKLIAETKSRFISELEYSFSDIYNMQNIDDICELIKEAAKKIISLTIEKNESISPVIKRILEYVKSNYSCDICLKTLASDLNTNANYLGQLFKEEIGEYFSEYVNTVRINKARELLKNTSISTKDIAINVGYMDVNYFYKVFKKYTGLSPSEFRNI